MVVVVVVVMVVVMIEKLFVPRSFVIDFGHDFDDQIFYLFGGGRRATPGNIGTYYEKEKK